MSQILYVTFEEVTFFFYLVSGQLPLVFGTTASFVLSVLGHLGCGLIYHPDIQMQRLIPQAPY